MHEPDWPCVHRQDCPERDLRNFGHEERNGPGFGWLRFGNYLQIGHCVVWKYGGKCVGGEGIATFDCTET